MVGSKLQVTPLLGSCSMWQKAPSGKHNLPDVSRTLVVIKKKKRLRNIRQRLYFKMLLFTRNERFVFGGIIFLKSGSADSHTPPSTWVRLPALLTLQVPVWK